MQYPSLSPSPDIGGGRKDILMWLENLKELKKTTGMTSKRIAEVTNLPERTVVRIFSGDTDNPYVDTLHRIVTALGGSLDDILADTKAVVATDNVVEAKDALELLQAQRDAERAENDVLKAKVAALEAEVNLLNKDLQHKNEILALHSYYKAHIEQLVKHINAN